jgi:ubiquinone/menaquinone biosynthesis C-methylase UbiE
LFLAGVVLALFSLSTLARTVNTLRELDIVEAERDRWQRPDDVLRMLDVREGSRAADLGSGAGYFALKLGAAVGHEGRVLAVDIRRTPLLFLRIRALLRGQNQLRVVRGDLDDPHLPAGAIDAVLVADTYHELTARTAVLEHAFRSLRPGGRLVIVDPTPGAGSEDGAETDTHRYERRAAAETELQRVGFAIVERDDRFIDSSRHRWWMIVARRAEL